MRRNSSSGRRRLAPWKMALASVSCAALIASSLATDCPAEDELTTTDVPLKRVVLFTAGVGFFERQADVTGPSAAEIHFRTQDVNDLLKSMVIVDPAKGSVATVTYGSKDPLAKTLQSFSIDLTKPPTLANLLGQVRGERVAVQAPEQVEGIVVGIETQVRRIDDEAVTLEYVNLLTDTGLRRIAMDDVDSVRLLNPKLQDELQQALAAMAAANSTDKKSVRLNFSGDGERTVHVGYIQETPLWKTSYRLVLDDDDEALLQGWALVENTSDEDWENVDLKLVSGRPVSFVMNLYDPLYLKRPLVEPELFANLRPQTYGRTLGLADSDGNEDERRERLARSGVAQEATPAPAADASRSGGFGGGGVGNLFAKGKVAAQTAMADSGVVGELFQYVIDRPVTLPRQKSAMLPIVNTGVEVEKLAIFDPSAQEKHPLNGLRLINKTSLHLMQGPITVFDDETYAGDAQILDLAPGEERLISYAVDLDTEISAVSRPHATTVTSVRFVRGVVEAVHKQRRENRYTVVTSADQPQKVLIQTPRESGWELIEPSEPSETTADNYRFIVEADPDKPVELVVREEYLNRRQVEATNLNDSTIRLFLSATEISEAVRAALEEVMRRKGEIAALTAEKAKIEAEMKSIDTEQDRIRKNMQAIGRTGTLYTRYLQKFSDQEDQLEKLIDQLDRITTDMNKRQQELNEYLANLTLDA